MLKQLLQEIKQNAAKAEQANADLTAKIDAKFEQSAAKAELSIAAVSYTHLDVYKRQVRAYVCLYA